jgi:hypothetical protein
MKKYLILILLSLSVGIIKAQNKFDKTITVIIKDFSEACGEDAGDAVFCLTDEKGGKITERYSCNYDNETWRVEPKDLITKDWILNAKYKGKKATLYCKKSSGGAGWVVEKVEIVNGESVSSQNLDKDFSKYSGCYKFLNEYISIGKFPVATRIFTNNKYVPLSKEILEKYYMTNGYSCLDTNFRQAGAEGFAVPKNKGQQNGDILIGVEKGGVIHNQNYNFYDGKFNLVPLNSDDKPNAGKFILREDGKYNLLINNALYVRQ